MENAGNNHQDIRALKTELRVRTLTARDQLRRPYREKCSDDLAGFADAIEAAAGPVSGKTVSGFWPINSEIDPRPVMHALRDRGARLALPVVLNRTTLEFREYRNDEDLIDAGFGTKGPSPNAARVDPDVMLIPLSVFDTYGGRIGYGAGFYDRAIDALAAQGKPPFKAGLAFALQEVPLVPQEPHDWRLDLIVTHEGPIKPERRSHSGPANDD
ncbi:MAG: 5-formyltetrahydrofolate cyclo-ligase [Pseudomonadota bacterium]